MKSLFILLTIVSSLFANNSHATDDISPTAVKNFENTFANAKDIIWTAAANRYKVQFSMNDQVVTAFYNEQGTQVAISRNITSLQLPIVLQAKLKKSFSNYWISDLFELSTEEGTSYYLTLEDAETKTVLKSSGNTSWTTYQKLCK